MFIGPLIFDPIAVIEDPYTIIFSILKPSIEYIVSFIMIMISFILLEYIVISAYGKIPILWFSLINITTYIIASIFFGPIILPMTRMTTFIIILLLIELIISLLESAAYISWFHYMGLIRGYMDLVKIVLLSLGANIFSMFYGFTITPLIAAIVSISYIGIQRLYVLAILFTITLTIVLLTIKVVGKIPIASIRRQY